MPLTFPSHAAAVLPLHALQRRLPLAALIVGSCAPDFAYALRRDGEYAHSVAGVITFCLPLSIVVFAMVAGAILPALQWALPSVGGVQLGRVLQARGLPRTGAGWGWAVAALLLGALTHLVWDGFTHASRGPGSALYGDLVFDLGGFSLPATNALQYASSAIGFVITAEYARRRYAELPAVEPGTWGRTGLLMVLAGAGAALSVYANRWDLIGVGWKHTIWVVFFLGARGAFLAVFLGSVAVNVVRRGSASTSESD